MKRRDFIATSSAALAVPAVGRDQRSQLLKWIPQTDLTVLDPVWTTAYITRTHSYLVFDLLYGQRGPAGEYRGAPQMVAGHVVENDGKTWKLTLRDGLVFHDGQKVLARDCVTSIKRWGVRDLLGQTLMQRTDDLSAPDDRTIVFRLKRPFPMLPEALGKITPSPCVIMPERLADTDPFKQVTEMVGSGPFRFKADERMQGSLVVYERFKDYVPRSDGTPDYTSGPKIAHFDRVEWHVIPDPATAAAALRSGEMDGWEQPTGDLLPLLERDPKLRRFFIGETGACSYLRPNCLFPPFDNPAIRRALFTAIDQHAAMIATMGEDPALRQVPCGFFPPNSPLASDAGMAAIPQTPDYGRAKKALEAAGYKGETISLLVATDFPILKGASDVVADMMKRCGMTVDYQALDWGTVVQRRASKKPPSEGGWNAFVSANSSIDFFSPASHLVLRGNGPQGWFGWPSSPKIEALRDVWFDTPELADQKRLGAEIQTQAFEDVPYWPLGQFFNPAIYRTDLTDMLHGFPIFWNIRRS